jgi:adenylylsulfate kinase
MNKSFVIWLTGLPSAGKTTLARMLKARLNDIGLNSEILDGDDLRKNISSDLGFSERDRYIQVKRVTYISNLLVQNGIIVIVSLISPLRAHRDNARKDLHNFIEVWTKCSLDTCIKRDVKGLYGLALKGQITDMTGIHQHFEEPLNPEIIVDTEHESPEECTHKILLKIMDLGYNDINLTNR